MKRLPSRLLTALKVSVTALLLLLFFILTLSFSANKMFADVWQQLGITQSNGNTNIFASITSGYLAYSVKNAKNISQKDRVAIVNQLVAYAKKYTSSEEFIKKYQNERKIRMSAKPMVAPVNIDSITAAEKQLIQLQIKQTEANVNDPNPKVRNAVPYRLENLKKELKAVEDGTSRVLQNKIKRAEAGNEAVLSQYKKDMEKLDNDFPSNPQDLIKRRLLQILDVTADVDYGAELKDGYANKFKVFVNPLYEKKSKEWKLAFRAGKETTDIIRAAAEKWLSEMAVSNRLRTKGPGPVGG